MSYWSVPREPRDQLVLFPTRLDETIGAQHPVRMLDEILGRLDWSIFEAGYDGLRGQPPIHPRVLAGVTLYGLMTRIRSSRALEESLQIRLDFRWLAEGRSIDHTTLSEFRRRHAEALKNLFVQVGLVARHLGLLPLAQLGYDGTRFRANNQRNGTRTPEGLQKLRQELAQRYQEQEQRLTTEDAREAEQMTPLAASVLPADLANTQRRLSQVDAALAELKRVETTGETTPSRIPLTDPQSRVTPNKSGGFAPNYTPLATVDIQSGLIAACDVIAMTNEEHSLIPQILQVQQDYGLPAPSPEVLADGMMASGANLQGLDELGVTLYSPAKSLTADENPAIRVDPTQPVPENQWDRLPTCQVTLRSGEKINQLTKAAFIYDEQQDCYWCPAGQPLPRDRQTVSQLVSGVQSRTRYKAAAKSCEGCPLRNRCLRPSVQRRDISRYDHEALSEELAQRMSTAEGKSKYARRSPMVERPFAVIKQQFGARQFLLRGLDAVRIEWRWLATAFNLSRLISLWPSRAGPQMSTLPVPQGS